MSTILICVLAAVGQGMVQEARLSHNARALVGLDEVALAVSTRDFGDGDAVTSDAARALIADLGGKALHTLVVAGVPVGSVPPTDEGPKLWLEVTVHGAQRFEGQLLRRFGVTLSLVDDVMVTRTGEFLRAVVWKDEIRMSMVAERDLTEAVERDVTTLCNRFADAYRLVNGIF